MSLLNVNTISLSWVMWNQLSDTNFHEEQKQLAVKQQQSRTARNKGGKKVFQSYKWKDRWSSLCPRDVWSVCTHTVFIVLIS